MDPAPPPVPEPQGIAEDLPCPKCKYNLRGLTVPRCPECGFRFDWADLPNLRHRDDPGSWAGLIFFAVFFVGVPVLLAFILPGGLVLPVMAASGALVGMTFCCSGVQAVVELVPASLIIGLPSWPRFRAWWEGVLIGHGACGTTLLISGCGFRKF